ncbi:hypothetical protein [Streptomyces griseoluteus]|uniref:hypothetical protein n=1 Tax=Streptomyces griseoluteus TaxID=29306 RepID=UPI0036874C28
MPQAEVVVVEPSAERRASLDGRAEVMATYEPRPDDLVVLAIPPQALEPDARPRGGDLDRIGGSARPTPRARGERGRDWTE